jgi:DNA helicase-2/ATP-dependent DNA helicase PcrA
MIENDLTWDLIEYSELEFDYIIEFLENYKLSPSDLNVFLEDPFQFLQRVIYKYPFLDNKFTIFWKVYHRTLELFYLKYKHDSKLPDKDYLTVTFSMLLKKEILTPDEYSELYEKGIEWLEWYYDLYKSSSREPILLEYSLRRKNIVWENVPLTWTIDKIEKVWFSSENIIWEGGQMWFFKEKVSLVDYKTWSAKSLGQIKWIDRYWNKKDNPSEGKYFRQLMFYKLLCENDREFMDSFEIWSLALDFVEWKKWNYKFVEVEISDEEFEEFKTTVSTAWSQITDINFWKDLLEKK